MATRHHYSVRPYRVLPESSKRQMMPTLGRMQVLDLRSSVMNIGTSSHRRCFSWIGQKLLKLFRSCVLALETEPALNRGAIKPINAQYVSIASHPLRLRLPPWALSSPVTIHTISTPSASKNDRIESRSTTAALKLGSSTDGSLKRILPLAERAPFCQT